MNTLEQDVRDAGVQFLAAKAAAEAAGYRVSIQSGQTGEIVVVDGGPEPAPPAPLTAQQPEAPKPSLPSSKND